MNVLLRRTFFTLAAALLVAFPRVPATAADADNTVIRLAATPIDSAAEAYYAVEKGFFETQGLHVELQSFANGGAIATAVASGAIDIGVASPVPLVLAHQRGVPFTVIFPAAVYDKTSPTTVLLVGKTSPITTAAGLTGKTIGTQAVQTISQIAPEQWIDLHGGDAKSTRFIEMPSAELPAALTSGRVDAIVAIEPTATVAAPTSRLLGDVYSALPAGFVINAWFGNRTWTSAHPQLVAKFAAAMAETARWANTHRAESLAILQKVTKTSPSVLQNMKRCVYGTQNDVTALQPNIDLAVKYGLLAKTFSAAEMLAQP